MNRSTFLILPFIFILIQSANSQYYYNQAFSFSGAAGDYAATDPGAKLNITGSFTIECWVKPINASSPLSQILVQKRSGSASSGYTMYLNAGKVAIRTNSSTRLTGNTVIPNGVWSHVAGTYNSSSGVFNIYLNGVLDGTATVSGAAPAADSDSLRFASGFNSPYAGLMDEIRVWNIALTYGQIQLRKHIPLGNGDTTGPYTGLVGAWRGNTITGGSGLEEINGYTAHMNGSAAFVATGTAPQGYMAFNTGILCSGADMGTCITIPHSPILNPTTAITLECWVFAVPATIPQIIFSKGDYYSGFPYRLLQTTEYQSFNLFAVSLNSVNLLGAPTYGGHIPTNKWTHLAFTYNSTTGDYIYYLNGEVTKTGNQSIGPLLNLTTDLTIGGGPYQPSLDGMLDEVRISDYVKTQEEIIKGMFTSIDANNDPNPSGHTAVFSFEGTLNASDGVVNPGYFSGTVNGIRFTQVFDNFGETPSPLDRWDAGNFAAGYRIHYVGLNFGGVISTRIDSIYMPQSLTISDINVFAALHDNNPGDINISLTNPEGSSTVVLHPGAGTNPGLHLFTVFDDQADSTIGVNALAPWSPRVKPVNSFSAFNTQNTFGWWKLIVTDIRPASSGGNFEAWGIQFNNQTLIGINKQSESNIPEKFALHQNYPNPFNPITAIKYDIAKSVNVKITVYDILGREIMIPVNEFKKAGYYSMQLDALSLASGVYFYRIEAGDFRDVKKMILVK